MKEVITIEMGDEILVECDFQTLDRTEITFGGPSTLNEMCLAFLFYYPRNNISSCMGYPDIQQIAHALGQEASDAMEGMIAMNYVEWNNETIKTAEKAAKEADQIVMIKTIAELQKNESGIIRDIMISESGPCHDISGRLGVRHPQLAANLRGAAAVISLAFSTAEIFPLPLLLLTQLAFTWLLTSSQCRI
ncbi:monooxygenase, DBH-like 2 [Chelydra serpentina]|uniref:Monooxygenase, DBH-like 2 n=1 Tax=Chelydra serpentina TaxID=8475 RepID=A0A8T1S4I6_CHESE|nr:monooxygenase, DBH-like 2 [Chelydra serpentina]